MLFLQINLDSVFWGNSIRSYLLAIGIILGVIILTHIIKALLLQRLKQWTERSATSIDNFLLRGINRTLLTLLYLGGVYLGLSNLKFPGPAERAIEVATKIIITYFAIRVVVSTISFLITSYIRRQVNGEEKLRQVKGIMIIITVVIWSFGLVFLLGNLGYDVTAIVAGLGIGGIAIALAAQTILGDLFSYFVIFFDRPFEVGDFVIVDDKMGTIENIGIKTTRLKSLSGEQLVFSNTDLTNSRLHNYKRMQRRRAVFKLGVVYETKPEQLKLIPGILRSIVEKQEDVLFDRAHFFSYGNFSLDFEICYYVLSDSYNKYMDVQQAINLEIFEEFARQNIEFAYPTQTLLQPDLIKALKETRKEKQEEAGDPPAR
ncbi:MAG TPA: mechanosensitive ion channel family protein [Anseongella sp.]|nr:mechanosensitive ion channel family protein [Anseongella sp.]